MEEIGFDWLEQINQESWRRRIWQLRRELSQEQVQPQQPGVSTPRSRTITPIGANKARSTSPS